MIFAVAILRMLSSSVVVIYSYRNQQWILWTQVSRHWAKADNIPFYYGI